METVSHLNFAGVHACLDRRVQVGNIIYQIDQRIVNLIGPFFWDLCEKRQESPLLKAKNIHLTSDLIETVLSFFACGKIYNISTKEQLEKLKFVSLTSCLTLLRRCLHGLKFEDFSDNNTEVNFKAQANLLGSLDRIQLHVIEQSPDQIIELLKQELQENKYLSLFFKKIAQVLQGFTIETFESFLQKINEQQILESYHFKFIKIYCKQFTVEQLVILIRYRLVQSLPLKSFMLYKIAKKDWALACKYLTFLNDENSDEKREKNWIIRTIIFPTLIEKCYLEEAELCAEQLNDQSMWKQVVKGYFITGDLNNTKRLLAKVENKNFCELIENQLNRLTQALNHYWKCMPNNQPWINFFTPIVLDHMLNPKTDHSLKSEFNFSIPPRSLIQAAKDYFHYKFFDQRFNVDQLRGLIGCCIKQGILMTSRKYKGTGLDPELPLDMDKLKLVISLLQQFLMQHFDTDEVKEMLKQDFRLLQEPYLNREVIKLAKQLIGAHLLKPFETELNALTGL